MFKFCSLASGSAGNATFISTSRTRILVDNGLSYKELQKRMAMIGESPEYLDAIVITHEHGDHCCGLVPLVRKMRGLIPVYITYPTTTQITWGPSCKPDFQHFVSGSSFLVGDIEVSSFPVSHNAVDNVGLTFTGEGVKAGISTDLGGINNELRRQFLDCTIILLESNHDTDILRVGPYPAVVKLAITGQYGHLSNADATAYLLHDLGPQTQRVILAHISAENNIPELVRMCGLQALAERGHRATLSLALQSLPTEAFYF